MTEKRMKLERAFATREELASFLRDLADRLEGKSAEEFDQLDPETFAKFRVGVKNKEGEYVLKFRAKAEAPESLCPEGGTCTDVTEDQEDCALCRPKYSKLKKRMKAQYKDISRSILDGEVPDEDIVEDFLSDSALMVTYKNKGDEYYPAYSKACEVFAEAYARRDPALMVTPWDEIRRLMHDCHDKHK